MFNFLNKFFYILGDRKHQLLFLGSLFLITSFLDTAGIGLVGPFILLANNPKVIHQHPWLSSLYNLGGFESEINFIVGFGLIVIVIFLLKSFIYFKIQKYLYQFSYKVKGDLSRKLLRAYLAAPYTFHLNHNSALLISNITREIDAFCHGIMITLLNTTSYGILVVFMAILLIKTNIYALLLILIMLVAPVLLYRRFQNRLSAWGKSASLAQVGIIRTINHSLGGFKDTRIIGCESYFEEQLGKHIDEFEQHISSSHAFSLLPRILVESVLIVFLVGLAIIFLLLIPNNQDLTGVLGVFALASIRLIPAISQITNSMGSLRSNSYLLDKLCMDLNEISNFKASSSSAPPGESVTAVTNGGPSLSPNHRMDFQSEIKLTKVSYIYPEAKSAALKDISLTITKGKSIALIGKSGAGKTTLVDLILGFLEPQSGDITVDGASIYPNLRNWQNLVGYIPQSIYLMDDTLERNIAFGVDDHLIDPDRLQLAIRDAQLSKLICNLPEGINTVIGEKGIRLSGGERQRIGIARALYHQRQVLVLDEATSALDNETEKLVNEAIKSLSGSKTLIIIAHRLTTIEHCDYIYVLDHGQMTKSGQYREVVLNEPMFKGSR